MNTDGKKPAKKQVSLFRELLPLIMIMIGLIALNTAVLVGLQAIDTGLDEINVLGLVCCVLVMSFMELVCILQAYVSKSCAIIIIYVLVFIASMLILHFSLVTRFFSFIIGLFG